MLGKVEKLMPPDKATNFPKIHAEVFYLASLFPLWFPRPPPAKQCWQKLKMMPPGRAINFTKIPDKLLPWLHFLQNAPQDHPLPDHVGKN